MTKSINPSLNFSNLTHGSIDDLHVHAEIIALKSLVVDRIYILKKKFDEKQVLSNN